jgi:5-methyltetrahydrofolate--homocysteine methyltransferase
MVNPIAEFTTKLASRSQVWPCALWDHLWTKTFSLSEMGFGEFLSVSQPELIVSAHRELLKAGASALVTNTFGANRLVMEDYGKADMVEKVNVESGRLALSVALEIPDEDRPLVLGSLGPTFEVRTTNSGSGDNFAKLRDVYLEQVRALWSAGVRMFHVESCDDPLKAAVALDALSALERETGSSAVRIITAKLQSDGVMPFGTSLTAFWALVQPYRPQAFGVVGPPEHLDAAISSLVEAVDVPLVAMAETRTLSGWSESPEALSSRLAHIVLKYGVSISGIGIDSSPEFIASLKRSLG